MSVVQADNCQICLTTLPRDDSARQLAHELVKLNLAACVTLLPGAQSIYQWQGQIEHSEECLLLIKTLTDKLDALTAYITANHPYTVPEFLVVPVESGLPDYLSWIKNSVT